MDEYPEFYITDQGQRVTAPAYAALAPCQIIMTSAETGHTGPTRIQEGEHFISEGTPCEQWLPLNRAAAERYQAWLDSLPRLGKDLTQDEIAEAAMELRPREGDPELSHKDWWQAVLKRAYASKEKRRGSHVPLPTHAQQVRRGAQLPVMPFMSANGIAPIDVGRPPPGPPQPQGNIRGGAQRTRQQQAKPAPAMAQTQPTDAPASAVG